MTKFIEQRVDELEKEVSDLKLIIHELRERPQLTTVINNAPQEPSTTNTVEDIIEFEGQQYRKVDREARDGDVVIYNRAFTHTLPNKPYKVVLVNDIIRYKNESGSFKYTCNGWGGKKSYDTYELIKEGLNPNITMVDETIEPLTPNQQRAVIIEKAKKFVKEGLKRNYKNTQGFAPSVWLVSENGAFSITHKVEFIVNEEKRSVVALIKLNKNSKVHRKGITKCHPQEVFNEHIGKAIALGRALGLDVSEFEQAVQPTNAVAGMQIQFYDYDGNDIGIGVVGAVEGNECHCGKWGSTNFEPSKTNDRIINDTKAIYGGVE